MTDLPPLYKFLTSDMRSPMGSGGWRKNRWRSVRGPLVACENGLHATTADNLLPFISAQLWRVEVGDEYVWHTDDSMGRKLVARRMRLVDRIDNWNDRTAREFACDCAERALPLFEQAYPGDARPRLAIETARRFARGEATREELADAAQDGDDAAWLAADAAAWAARGLARDDAWAAEAAAWAARGLARDDARATSVAAARAAVRTAERAWQSQHLIEMLGLEGVAP